MEKINVKKKNQISPEKQNGRHLKWENCYKCKDISTFVSYKVRIFEVGKTTLVHCSPKGPPECKTDF